MANLKSSKKRARQNRVRRQRNLSRRTAIKTAVKKVVTSLTNDSAIEDVRELLREAESKISRAKGKGLLKSNTAARKISRLAKKVSALAKENNKK